MAIETILLEKAASNFTVACRTEDTKYLDTIYGIEGKPLTSDRIQQIIEEISERLLITQCKIVVPYLIRATGRTIGSFGGVLESEITSSSVKRSIPEVEKAGYVQRFKYDDDYFVAPTKKCSRK